MARVLNQFKEACESANGNFAKGPREFVCSNKHGTMSMSNFKGRRNESAQVEVMDTKTANNTSFDVKGRIKDADRVVYDQDRDSIVAEDSDGKSEIMLHNKHMDDEDNGGYGGY